ncbi:hypothetical protein [Azospirillum canadense]|uniref:hypothetical protein n=1 Tax=Azospirillum canadense TaxID=403962 RepID=UPI0022264258|nr:hypothetical protein [Azospirillum canadense]MCW2239063.1 hypothetical protein [Azospirillum canadense]
MTGKTIKPFANESEALTLGELIVENHIDRLALFGSLDLTRDQVGLRHARALKALLDEVVHALESDKALPENIAPPEPPDTAPNPFV